VLVAPEFLTGASYSSNPNVNLNYPVDDGLIQRLQKEQASLVYMDPKQCQANYSVPVQSDWRNVLVVLSDYHSEDNSVAMQYPETVTTNPTRAKPDWALGHSHDPGSWSVDLPNCGGTVAYNWDGLKGDNCANGQAPSSTSATTSSSSATPSGNSSWHGGFWTPPTRKRDDSGWDPPLVVHMQYCLAERNEAQCAVDVSTTALAVVIVFNVVKLVCMVCTLLVPKFEPLITIGDAIASFLQEPDTYTEHKTFLSAAEVRSRKWCTVSSRVETLVPRQWKQPTTTLGSAVNPRRWIFNLGILIVVLACGIYLLWLGAHSEQVGMWSQDLGQANPSLMITKTIDLSLIALALIANAPQLVVSAAYLSFNALLTSMMLGLEFSRFAVPILKASKARKNGSTPDAGVPLRVSKRAKGSAQKSSGTFSLPYAYSIPLSGAHFVLHFFLSQAIFVVLVSEYGQSGQPGNETAIAGCGWSIKGVIGSVVLGAILIVALCAIAVFGRMHQGVPLVGSSSAAIAAACHPRADDEGAELRKLRYGVLEDVTIAGRAIGRVGFGTSGVGALKEGQEYV
jgi:hypothetical protein